MCQTCSQIITTRLNFECQIQMLVKCIFWKKVTHTPLPWHPLYQWIRPWKVCIFGGIYECISLTLTLKTSTNTVLIFSKLPSYRGQQLEGYVTFYIFVQFETWAANPAPNVAMSNLSLTKHHIRALCVLQWVNSDYSPNWGQIIIITLT